MSTYVIGDIQGCLSELKQLLEKIKFSADKDIIWFTGDLVNRGPKSLETLRYVKNMAENAVSVLGNHDLHMLAIVYGLQKQRPSDTLDAILTAKDKDSLMDWVANLPLMHTANNDQHILVHAGIYPSWTIAQAKQYATEVEHVLKNNQRIEFLSHMYGNQPEKWNTALEGWERLRFITNTFTRMRYCTHDKKLELKSSIAPNQQIDSLLPWYTLRSPLPLGEKKTEQHIFFGHWSTLGLVSQNSVHCLDTGCLWGGALTAMKIDEQSSHPSSKQQLSTQQFSIQQIDCKGQLKPLKTSEVP